MTKLALFIAIISLSFHALADKPATYIVPLKDGDYVMKVEAFVSPTVIRTKQNRTYHWLKSKVIHTTKGGYSGLLLHGKFESFYSTNQLKEQGQFKSGLKVGTWKSWHDNGQLKEIYLYKDGRLHGAVQKYDENGRLIISGKYKKGERHGTYAIFEDGVKTSEEQYLKGQIKQKAEEKKGNKEMEQLEKAAKKGKNASKDKVKTEKTPKKEKSKKKTEKSEEIKD